MFAKNFTNFFIKQSSPKKKIYYFYFSSIGGFVKLCREKPINIKHIIIKLQFTQILFKKTLLIYLKNKAKENKDDNFKLHNYLGSTYYDIGESKGYKSCY